MYQRTFQLVKKYVCFILVLLVPNLAPQMRGQLNYTPKGDKTILRKKIVSPKLSQVGDVLLPQIPYSSPIVDHVFILISNIEIKHLLHMIWKILREVTNNNESNNVWQCKSKT